MAAPHSQRPRAVSGARLAPPSSLIPPGSQSITPQMFPLADLKPHDLERIVQAVPGGVANLQDIYPLTALQEGMLFHHLLDETADIYVRPTLLELASRARLDAFVDALQRVVDRHDILRTAILWEQLPQPLQVVYRKVSLPVDERRLDPDRDPTGQVKEWLQPARQRLDLRRAPWLRLQIASDPRDSRHYVLLQSHHLASDAQSYGILIDEVLACLQGEAQRLPEPVPYRDHVAQTLARARVHDSVGFFRRKLGDIVESTAPFQLVDVHGDGSRIDESQLMLEPPLAMRARAQARRSRVSVATLFHAAWGLVVGQTSGRNDPVYGTVLFGWPSRSGGAQQRLGMFLNTLPLRLRLDGTTQELVTQTHQELLELLSYQHSSLAVAQRCSGIAAAAPLFTALMNYRRRGTHAASDWSRVPGARVLANVASRAAYPMTLSVEDDDERFVLTAQTDRIVSPVRILSYMHGALRSLVETLERAPSTPVSSLSILPEAERHQVLDRCNATERAYPEGKLIHELFEERATSTPQAIALTYEGQSLTYAELNTRANRLARHLVARGVGPDERVGLCIERGLDMVVGLLGILKAGGAYVPLDPQYPPERLAYMLQDAAPRLLLTQERLTHTLPWTSVVAIDRDWEEIAAQDALNPDPRSSGLTARNLAYVIYTSGSTGNPKGVMIEHRGVVNFLYSMQEQLQLDAGDRLLAVTTLCFDIAALEIYLPLFQGAQVLLATREAVHDGQQLIQMMETHALTVMQATPATWRLLVGEGWKGRRALTAWCGGEALTKNLSGELLERVGALWNLYGPTETTIWSCSHRVTTSGAEHESVESIGKPIANTEVHVLDSCRRPAPLGVSGDIYIGGRGVARGYWNRKPLTADRFVANPFSADSDSRLYRTGDLGRRREDGTIDYLGRNDHQVKIRGFRIELGEIEAQLVRHERVKEAVVVAREEAQGETRLVAYVVDTAPDLQTPDPPLIPQLREYLQARLPAHMTPSIWAVLKSLPLTPNGKIDRRALPVPQGRPEELGTYVAPRTELERTLVEIWTQVLRVDRVGIEDNFFELGGHSLLGMRLCAGVAERLAVRPPVAMIFQRPTVRQMAERIAQLHGDPVQPLESRVGLRRPSDRIPLTFTQQLWWDFLELGSRASVRGVGRAMHLSGQLNIELLRNSFVQLLCRHEALRTRIAVVDGAPVQHIDEFCECSLEVIDLTGAPGQDPALAARHSAEKVLREPFHLSEGPVWAMRLLKVGDDEHVLVIAIDHIVSDIVSMDILWRELFTLYAQSVQGRPQSLPAVPAQFCDYAVWLHHTQHSWMHRHGAYWTERLAGARRVQLAGEPIASTAGFQWVRQPVRCVRSHSERPRAWSLQERNTPVMCALTAYVALISRWCDTRDVVVAFLTTGRLYPELENTVGYFAAPLFLRLALFEDDSFLDLLGRVTREYGAASEHADSGRVAAQIPRPEFLWNPRFNWIITDTAVTESGLKLRALEIRPPDVDWGGEVEMRLSQTTEGIAGTLSYRADRLSTDALEHFGRLYPLFLQKLFDEPGARIDTVPFERMRAPSLQAPRGALE